MSSTKTDFSLEEFSKSYKDAFNQIVNNLDLYRDILNLSQASKAIQTQLKQHPAGKEIIEFLRKTAKHKPGFLLELAPIFTQYAAYSIAAIPFLSGSILLNNAISESCVAHLNTTFFGTIGLMVMSFLDLNHGPDRNKSMEEVLLYVCIGLSFILMIYKDHYNLTVESLYGNFAGSLLGCGYKKASYNLNLFFQKPLTTYMADQAKPHNDTKNIFKNVRSCSEYKEALSQPIMKN